MTLRALAPIALLATLLAPPALASCEPEACAAALGAFAAGSYWNAYGEGTSVTQAAGTAAAHAAKLDGADALRLPDVLTQATWGVVGGESALAADLRVALLP